MKIEEKTRDEKLQYNINGKITKASALSSPKLINMNTLHVTKYWLFIKVEW